MRFNLLMMGKIDINWNSRSNTSIVEAIGEYLKNERLNLNKTQAEIAKDAGVNRWTLSQIENGEAINLNSLIQILRALDALSVLDKFNVTKQISPIALAKLEQQKRHRASHKKSNNHKTEHEC